jgi:hypothetical protein
MMVTGIQRYKALAAMALLGSGSIIAATHPPATPSLPLTKRKIEHIANMQIGLEKAANKRARKAAKRLRGASE